MVLDTREVDPLQVPVPPTPSLAGMSTAPSG